MITQEQAKRAVELLEVAIVSITSTKDGRYEYNTSWNDEKDKLLAEIKTNNPVTTTNAKNGEHIEVKAKPWDGKEILVPSVLGYKNIVTKGDKIRSMTDEEMAEYIDKHMPKYWCKNGCPASEFCKDSDEETCRETILKWLKKEADNNAR